MSPGGVDSFTGGTLVLLAAVDWVTGLPAGGVGAEQAPSAVVNRITPEATLTAG